MSHPTPTTPRWRCPTCGRGFSRRNQRHSCRLVPLETHLPAEGPVRALFDTLVDAIEADVGPCELVPLPCCIHLAAGDDFLAVLPQRERLEVRFSLPRRLDHPRIVDVTQTARTAWKHRAYVSDPRDVDTTLLGWIAAAYRPALEVDGSVLDGHSSPSAAGSVTTNREPCGTLGS